MRAHRRRNRDAFRATIMAAARAIVATEGLEALSMRRLALRLDCSAMTLYSYFDDKHALLHALAHQGFDALAERLGREKPAPPIEAVRSMFLAYADFGLDHPDDYRVLFMTAGTAPDGAKAPEDLTRNNPAFAIGVARVEACIGDGAFIGDPHAIATMLWTAVHGAVAAALTFPDFPFGDRHAYVARVVDWAVAAMRAETITPIV